MQKTYSSELKKLGKKIKKYREAKEFTQQKLADICDVDIRTIQRIEVGDQKMGIIVLFALADAFEVPASELIDF